MTDETTDETTGENQDDLVVSVEEITNDEEGESIAEQVADAVKAPFEWLFGKGIR